MAPLLDVSLEELFLGYQPDQDAIARLYEAEVEYEEKYRRMQDELSGKLDDRTSEMAALREVIESQKATIRTQDEIIAMLRRRISEESSSEN